MNLRVHRLAVAEIDHEFDYYEARRAGLGDELDAEIESVFAMILRFPEAAPQWRSRPDRRVAVLDRFPFALPYQIVGDEIVILALAHSSRAGLLVQTPLTRHATTARSSPRPPRCSQARAHQ